MYNSDPDTPRPVVTPKPANKNDGQINNLEQRLYDQQQQIDRMHKEIVRLRELINQLAAMVRK
jgi:hypothetical protein